MVNSLLTLLSTVLYVVLPTFSRNKATRRKGLYVHVQLYSVLFSRASKRRELRAEQAIGERRWRRRRDVVSLKGQYTVLLRAWDNVIGPCKSPARVADSDENRVEIAAR